ncbi:unnamed protein product [Onchocerca flexuosa]|uniref:Uncharacterized protein n=1 Tax=Onchocerca flexuosa TaxID=387005 RepID=A0A183HGG1_9BILA|nr:unnamed protein product [Onchocerca flexuosa]
MTKINVISKWHFMKFMMQNPPIYSYSNEDEEWDKYGSYKPVLHITICQLCVILQRLQNDVNEFIYMHVIPTNSRLNQLITVTLLPNDDIQQYVTLHLHPFISDENDNYDELFRRFQLFLSFINIFIINSKLFFNISSKNSILRNSHFLSNYYRNFINCV